MNFAAGIAETLAEQRRAQLMREKQQKQIQKALENALTELDGKINKQGLCTMASCNKLRYNKRVNEPFAPVSLFRKKNILGVVKNISS